MSLKIVKNMSKRIDIFGQPFGSDYVIGGQTKEFVRYEKSIFNGKIRPFQIKFVSPTGHVTKEPKKLTLSGKLKSSEKKL